MRFGERHAIIPTENRANCYRGRLGASGQTEIGHAERLNHIQLLEAESIHIFREVASEFQNPVMLYSIGKDSSVMLRLAQKAFFPAPIPFPLLHVDTGYKFREMIEFRDRYTAELGLKLHRLAQ